MDPRVGVQVTNLPEAFSTHPAGIWFLPSMDPLVHVQMLAHGELLPTDITGVDPWLPSHVALDVSLQDSVFNEGLSTELTDKWPLTSMQLHMSLQRPFPGKVLATLFATEGFLASVCPHVDLHVPETDTADVADPAGFPVALDVQLQTLGGFRLVSTDSTARFGIINVGLCMSYKVPFVVKGITTDLAAVRRSQTWFPALDPNRRNIIGPVAAAVSPQLCAFNEALPAGFTAEWHLSIMGLHVALQRASVTERSVADVAPEWFLCRVDSHMCYHVALLVEDFAADVAAERFLSSVQPQVGLLGPDRRELLTTYITGPAAVTVHLKVPFQDIDGLQTLAAETT